MINLEDKPIAMKEDTFDKLEIRLGRVISAQIEPSAPKKSYRLEIDFGKFGRKFSVGRFTQHSADELQGKQVLGVLNFATRQIGNVVSEVLVLGVQYPKADSGEATIVTPLIEAKIGSKLF
jgi:tRNA-binding protein